MFTLHQVLTDDDLSLDSWTSIKMWLNLKGMRRNWHKALQRELCQLPAGGGDAASASDPHDSLVAPSSASDYDGDLKDEVRDGVSIIIRGKQKAVLQDATEHTQE